MNGSAYWNSQYNYYMNNQPPKADSYYNEDYDREVRKSQSNIDNLVAEKDKSWAATAQKQDEYDAFSGTMKSYGDVYSSAEDKFGVKVKQDAYEESKKALALAESTLSALPSSINTSSNRVLTQAQREARYNTLSDRVMTYKGNLLAKTSAYEEVWKKASQQQSDYAKAEMVAQYGKLGQLNNSFVLAMNNYNKIANNLIKAEQEKMQWERQYRIWQSQQYLNANQVWYNKLSNALSRYHDALQTEMVQAEVQREIDRLNNSARGSSGAWWERSERVEYGSDVFKVTNSRGESYYKNIKTKERW